MAHAEGSREPTPQQRAAIVTHDRNVIVVAGAGTGKTFVLVRRFVALLEANPDWPVSAVVAITFTNRAADEMRARVRAELEHKRRNAADVHTRRRWSDLLGQIETARITTIHGLCSEIVRANAASIGVDPGFEVMDEPQAAILREDAVTFALAGAVQPGILGLEDAALAGDVVARYGESDIRKALKDALRRSDPLPRPRDLDALRDEWEQHAEHMFSSHFAPTLDLNPPDADDKLADIARHAIGCLLRFNRVGASIDERLAGLRDLSDIKLIGGKVANWADLTAAKAELGQARDDARTLVKVIGEAPGDQDIDAAALLDGWRVLIERARSAYAELKQRRAVLDYDDLERKAAEALSFPAVAARYAGAEFRHVMVDEFQDTNERQWKIVRAVAPPSRDGSLFVVGDPKQSIYAFRGADVTVFEVARHDIEIHGGTVLFLTESFRTHAPLIEALNDLFGTVLRRPPDSLEPGVFVTFDASQRLVSRRADAPVEPCIAAHVVPGGNDRESGVSREARAIAQQIRKMVRTGSVTVYDRTISAYRHARYGDIAVLLRSFRGKVEVFERALTDAGIPYVTLGGQGFYGRREVKDVLNALRALHNPADELALAAALHSPLFALSDTDLLLLRQPRDDSGFRALPLRDALLAEAASRREQATGYDSVIFAADVILRLMPLVGRAPVETVMQSLIHATGYMATLAGLPDGQQMRANVEKLIDRARDSGLTALNQFVRYLNDMTEAEAREGGVPLEADDAVRLSTIHSSKGLEYPVVWIADAGSKSRGERDAILNWTGELGCKLPGPDQTVMNPGGSSEKVRHPYVYRRNLALQTERDAAESLRLLYVAATRAQDALFVSGSPDRNSVQGWLALISECMPLSELIPAPPTLRSESSESAAARIGDPPDFPLARAVPGTSWPARLHLPVGDVIALGGSVSAPDSAARGRFERHLRGRLLDEHNEPVPLLTYDPDAGGLAARRVGVLIHNALRLGYDAIIDSDRDRAVGLIKAMAWEAGITQPHHIERAVDIALGSLSNYRHGPLAAELSRAVAVYRELPFVYQRDGHIVHGTIDLLFRSADGAWTVVEHKLDAVACDDSAALFRHARTYLLQMAVFTEAVAAQIGTPPRAVVIFVRCPTQPVVFNPADMRAELNAVPLGRLTNLIEQSAP